MWLRHTQDVISIVISLVALGWLNSDSKGNFWWHETYQKMKWTHLASERLHPVKGYFLNLKLLRSNLGPPSSRSWEKLQISAFREQIKRYVKGNTGQLHSQVVKIRAFSNLLEMRHCICACHMVHVFVPSSLWRTSKAGTEQIKKKVKSNGTKWLKWTDYRGITSELFPFYLFCGMSEN